MDFTQIPKPKDRKDWLAVRKHGVGSSDAPVALGMSKYATPLELYLDKIDPEVKEDDTKEHQYWGHQLEEVVAKEYSLRSGFRVQRINYILRSKMWPHMMAQPDRLIVGAIGRGPGLLECKTSHKFMVKDWGPSGTDQIPEDYMVQVQHQLGVTGYAWAVLAVLIGGREFRTYPVERNNQIILDIAELTGEFWSAVQDRTPPAIDFDHPAAKDLVKRLYPGTNGEVVRLASDWGIVHRRVEEVKKEIKTLAAEKDKLEAMVLAEIGEGSCGLLPDGSGYTRALVKGSHVSFDRADSVVMRFSAKVKGVNLNSLE